MTMASSLLPGNPKRIDSSICDSSLIFNPVIDCHHLVQLFQRRLLLLSYIKLNFWEYNNLMYYCCVSAKSNPYMKRFPYINSSAIKTLSNILAQSVRMATSRFLWNKFQGVSCFMCVCLFTLKCK